MSSRRQDFNCLNKSALRRICKTHSRRLGTDFEIALRRFVERKLAAACAVHNGGKQTIDLTIAAHVGLLP